MPDTATEEISLDTSLLDITYAQINVAASKMGTDLAGVPIPMPGYRLVLDAKNPYRHLEGVDIFKTQNKTEDTTEREPDPSNPVVVNIWTNWPKCYRVYVVHYTDEQGQRKAYCQKRYFSSFMDRMRVNLQTLGIADVWPMAAEARAQESLFEQIGERRFQQYAMAGMFMETSRRSGIKYLFRRNRPVIALADDKGQARFLVALCMHPLGYYDGTFAGCMVPTDDILAMLLLMRSDEHMLWRRCNQHRPEAPQAGL